MTRAVELHTGKTQTLRRKDVPSADHTQLSQVPIQQRLQSLKLIKHGHSHNNLDIHSAAETAAATVDEKIEQIEERLSVLCLRYSLLSCFDYYCCCCYYHVLILYLHLEIVTDF